ncbi:MAG: hypothetical protein GXO06_03795, partial [Epsilonproteobacteria bacterium]|nr:hypothetical protein [Campylobacterota bacterium]
MRKLTITSIVATTLLLVGCGSGGSSSSTDSSGTTTSLVDTPTAPPAISTPTVENLMVGKGYYVDSAVEGVDYECGNQNGTTDANGTFNFERGEGCEFKLGQVKIREVDGYLLEDNITILEDNETVAQLLQTLDADGNASNGIQIPEHSGGVVADTIASIDDLNQEILEAIHTSIKTEYPNEYNGTVVDINQTREHLAETRQELASENRRTQHDIENDNGHNTLFDDNNLTHGILDSDDNMSQNVQDIMDSDDNPIHGENSPNTNSQDNPVNGVDTPNLDSDDNPIHGDNAPNTNSEDNPVNGVDTPNLDSDDNPID